MGGGGRATALIAERLGLRTLDLALPVIDRRRRSDSMIRGRAALGDARRADRGERGWPGSTAVAPAPRDAIFLGGGGNSVGAQSVEAEWMRLAGFASARLPGGRASLELLATRPPAVLLRSTYRRDRASLGQRWLDHPLASPKLSQDHRRPMAGPGPAPDR